MAQCRMCGAESDNDSNLCSDCADLVEFDAIDLMVSDEQLMIDSLTIDAELANDPRISGVIDFGNIDLFG